MAKKSNFRLYRSYSSEEWNKLLLGFDATVNYTFWFINYVEILNELNQIKNYTFVVYQDQNPVAIVPLYVEKIHINWQISMGQEPVYAPIFCKGLKAKDQYDLFVLVMNNINRIAKKYSCVLSRFHHSPLLEDVSYFKYYKEFGFNEDILSPNWYIFKCKYSYLIKLDINENLLFKNIRKGHKSNINKSKKNLTLHILDKDKYSKDLFSRYVDLYFQVKGDKRSIKAFKFDSIAVKTGFQTIMLCEYKNDFIGAIALHTFNSKARYNSSLVLYNNCKGIYPTHFLIWSAILYLKDRKFELFEIGEQVVKSDLYEITDKEKNLSHFKSGWGANLVPWLKVQKNY